MTVIPTWDLFITLFFIIGVAYGFILQRDRVVLTMIAAYVALVATQVLSVPLQQFFSGEKAFMNQVFIRGITNAFAIQTTIFVLVIAIVTSKSGLEGKSSGGLLSPFELLAFSFLNTAFIATNIFYFMPEAMRNSFALDSRLASYMINFHTYWMVLPIVLLIVLGIKKGD